MKKNRPLGKRCYLLLEVIIALFLVALCALPLMQAHFHILRSEYALIDDVLLDHAVGGLYAQLLEDLYHKRNIRWDDIARIDHPVTPTPIEDTTISSLGYTGTRSLMVKRKKVSGEYSKTPDELGNKQDHLLQIFYHLSASGKPERMYTYELYVRTPTEIARED